jgi:hypothetical protein
MITIEDMKRTVDSYELEIRDGDPPDQGKTSYDTKMPSGALFEIAKRIKPGQYVENLSAGSLGKLRKQIEERGLNVITRRRQGDLRGALYVVTDRWLTGHPDRS